MSGGIADPRSVRLLSILPDEDADEAYCVRHGRVMRSVDPVIHSEGALYTTTETFSTYTCTRCLTEVASEADAEWKQIFQASLVQSFDQWDQGDAPGDWFRYLTDGSIEELDDGSKFVAFDRGDSGD